MMQQYQRLRASVPADTLLLFRLGDFYELFFEDAKEASALLNLALTKRNGVPMCGMPYHAAQNYIAKLIKAGRRVAVCDQTSEPQPGKIVTREITQIITAGTVSELDLLEAKRANYLGAIFLHAGLYGFAYADLSTGEFRLTEVATSAIHSRTSWHGSRRRNCSSAISNRKSSRRCEGALAHDSYAFLPEQAVFTLCEHFEVKSLDGFGCGAMPAAVAAAGAIVHYLKHQLRRKIDHLTALRCEVSGDHVMLDLATQANLELVDFARGARHEPARGAGSDGHADGCAPVADLDSAAVARTRRAGTPAGDDRRSAAGAGAAGFAARSSLKGVRDIERAVGRLSQASGNARDLVALRTSLEQIPELKRELAKLIERASFGTSD